MAATLQSILSKFLEAFGDSWDNTLAELGTRAGQLSLGNQLRPQICLLGYLTSVDSHDWEEADFSKIADISVSIELVHKASLILDDWIDRDDKRHGIPTLHIETSPEQAVLLAIKMVGLSMHRLKTVFSSDTILPHHYFLCLDNLVKTIYSMASGAYRELVMTSADMFNSEAIQEIARLETSEIIGNSLLLGYYAGIGDKRNPVVEEKLKAIGDQCGYIFQVMNDMEAFSNPEKLIQHKGDLNLDIGQMRKNIVISLLYQVAGKRDKRKLEMGYGTDLIALTQKYKIIEYFTEEIRTEYRLLLEDARSLQAEGLSADWCDLFCNFLELVKQFAEARL